MSNELQRWLSFRPWQRHSLVLMVGGLVYIGHGVTFLILGDLSERREAAMYIALSVFPLETWAILFIIAGAMSVLSSRWPSFLDSWGYMVLTGLSAGWSAMYFVGYFIGGAPISNVSTGLIWGMMAFMWWAVSGLSNPAKPRVESYGPD